MKCYYFKEIIVLFVVVDNALLWLNKKTNSKSAEIN